jgi:predicted lipoprotein with Yx(FWY)xxD motif
MSSRSIAAAALALVLTACAGANDSDEPTSVGSPGGSSVSTSAPGTTPTGSPEVPTTRATKDAERPARQGRVIITGDSQFGPMLFDRSGQAIYLFDKETSSTPRCYGACAEAWPPVLTAGPPQARGGAEVSLLGTVRRRDGRTQVTYDGQPLYFYAHEGKNQVLCHDIREYGGLWLVVTPEGPPAPSAG